MIGFLIDFKRGKKYNALDSGLTTHQMHIQAKDKLEAI